MPPTQFGGMVPPVIKRLLIANGVLFVVYFLAVHLEIGPLVQFFRALSLIPSWLVLGAILVGKPIGIVAATVVGVAAGLQRPIGVTWSDLTVLGVVAAIGFTVALFFATAAFPPGGLLDEAKMGALLSFSAAILAFGLALMLGVGRLARASAEA